MHFQAVKNFRSSTHIRAFILLLVILAMARAQLPPGEKLVKVADVSMVGDAVMITNISVSGNPIECGLFVRPNNRLQPVTSFKAGSDWLQQMAISLFNRTNKTLVAGSINMRFLDTGDCRSLPCASVVIQFGQPPAVDAYDERTGKPLKTRHPERLQLNWKPEETFIVRISDYLGDIEQSTLSNFMSVSAVSSLSLDRGSFYFDDGMRWVLGRFSVPDPGHQGKFKQLSEDYFPGPRGRNLPPGFNK